MVPSRTHHASIVLVQPSLNIVGTTYVIPVFLRGFEKINEPHIIILPLDLPAQAGDRAMIVRPTIPEKWAFFNLDVEILAHCKDARDSAEQ